MYCINAIIFGLIISSINGDLAGTNNTSSATQEDSIDGSNILKATSHVVKLSSVNITTSATTILPQNNHTLVPNSCTRKEGNTYDCKRPGGYISISNNQKGTSIYNLILEIKEEAIIHFSKSDVSDLGEKCSIKIEQTLYNDNDLLAENNVHLFNESTQVTVTNEHSNCSLKFFYRTSLPYIASAQLLDLQGTIEAPIDPDGLQSYRPLTTFIWYLEPSVVNCFLELKISKFDLGSSTDVQISPETDSLSAEYDFLSIGLDINGTNSYEDDYTFFGKLNVPAVELLPSCSARITFSSKLHYQNTTAFRIDYSAKDIFQIEETKYPSSNMLRTWIAINGASISYGETIEDIFPAVKQAIAEMANNYLPILNIQKTVREENVTIYEVGTCSIFYCRFDCMAFLFTIDLNDDNDEPIFKVDTLNSMVENTETIIIVTSFQVCHEIPYINWGFPIFFLLLVIFCSFAIIVMAFCEREDTTNMKRRNNLQYLISEWDTTWKRQSMSDISTSSASSQAPFVKKRFYFPGFGARKNQSKQSNYPTYEVTEFKEITSKPIDPNSLGLNDVISNPPKPMEFSNYAFHEDDEIFNKSSSVNSSDAVPESADILTEQSFQNANPFRHQMILDTTFS